MIGSTILEVLRQGIWASITGGWYYDPRQPLFSNTVHMYLWLWLLCCPMLLHLCLGFTAFVIGAYGGLTFALFATIKTSVWYMHRVFDTCECVEEEATACETPSITVAGTSTHAPSQTIEMPELLRPESQESVFEASASAATTSGPLPLMGAAGGMRVHDASEAKLCEAPALVRSSATFTADVHQAPVNQQEESSSRGSSNSDEATALAKALLGPGQRSSSTNDLQDCIEMRDLSKGKTPAAVGASRQSVDADEKDDDVIVPLHLTPSEFTLHKRSEPSFEFRSSAGSSRRRRQRAVRIAESPDGAPSVRRAKSYVETTTRSSHAPLEASISVRDDNASTLLSENALQDCRKQARKSYPGKSNSSVDIFLNSAWLPTDSHYAVFSVGSTAQSSEDRMLRSELSIRHEPISHRPSNTADQSSCHGSLPTSPLRSNAREPVCRFSSMDIPFPDIPERDTESGPSMPSTTSFPVESKTTEERKRALSSPRRSLPTEHRSVGPAGLSIYPAEISVQIDHRPTPPLADEQQPQTSAAETTASPLRSPETPNLRWLFSPDSEDETSDDFKPPDLDLNGMELDYSPQPGPSRAVPRWRNRSTADYSPTRRFGQYAMSSGATGGGRRNSEMSDALRARIKEDLEEILEEILDRHPDAVETLESIRDVILHRRQAELTRDAGSVTKRRRSRARDGQPRSSHRHRRRRATGDAVRNPAVASTSAAPLPSSDGYRALAGLISRPGAHVASSHEDTSFGAVHCFQDEEANWWAYTFDDGGAGMVQELGSSKAILESWFADPSFAGAGADDSGCSRMLPPRSWDEPRPSTSLAQDDRSSSSSESFIGDVPSSVLHPGIVPSSAGDVYPSSSRGGSVTFSTNSVRPHRPRLSGLVNPTAQHRNPLQLMVSRTLHAAQNVTNPVLVPPPLPDRDFTAGDMSTITGSSGHAVLSGSFHTSSAGSGSSLNRIRFLAGFVNAAEERNLRKRKSQYYKVPLCGPFKHQIIKLRFDRLQLLALFDRNTHWLSAAFDIWLATVVSIMAGLFFQRGYYHDLWTFWFCVVVAAAHFSLLRSVQPDAASPIHGYNWLVSYSRPAYFCAATALAVGLEAGLRDFSGHAEDTLSLYGLEWRPYAFMEGMQSFLLTIILLFPIIFTIGLLPQIKTFLMHILEQIDMCFFGGTACVSLASAAFSLGRSVLCTAVLSLLGYVAMTTDKTTLHIAFSCYCSLLIVSGFLLSRSTSHLGLLWPFARQYFPSCSRNALPNDSLRDLLPDRLNETLSTRFKADILSMLFIGLLVFALHCSTLFNIPTLQSTLMLSLAGVTAGVGLAAHYFWPQLRKHTPWLLVAKPILRTREHHIFEYSHSQAHVMWFERLYVWMCFLERSLLYPLLLLSAVTKCAPEIAARFGLVTGAVLMSIAGLKLLRTAYCNSSQLYLPLCAALFLFQLDQKSLSLSLLLDFYLLAVLYPKFGELLLKLQFVFVYIEPWQITWGSAFHAFAHPFSVPHSALLLAQSFFSTIVSAPLNPFLGSALFLSSYMRPVKFWEKDYNTKRVDNSHLRLANQIDRGPTTDDNNLNSIVYEHLTRSLQTHLCGDLMMGRWSTVVTSGDCFILASYYVNCLVHIVEVGNGFVTFQLRGLEFRGTYCQQREVEAISEDIIDSAGCCCCEPGRLPGLLSFNTAWNIRCLAWEVTASKYILDGYSITDNSAASMLQVYELRKLLVTLYVKCVIYYAIRSPKLEEWLSLEPVLDALTPIRREPKYVDVDPVFSLQIDEDYDSRLCGISRTSFVYCYLDWITYCVDSRERPVQCEASSDLVALCYALSLVGRRTLGVASHNRHCSVDSFLYGLHALFKGDFRITSVRDEWVFADMEFLRFVVAPAIRMALKLHQDHFTSPDECENARSLYETISINETSWFISHEGDPAWRHAVLSNVPSLLALRHVFDDGSDEYKIIMLNRRYLNFRVIKLNRECVRGLWAGQQQELIFLRNRNPERGSIQNARQVLRNMINSSADQPIGYPIFVSPLMTSFCETHPQLQSIIGPAVTFRTLKDWACRVFFRLRQHCGMSCSSNLSLPAAATSVFSPVLQPAQSFEETATAPSTTTARCEARPQPSTVAAAAISATGGRNSATIPPSFMYPPPHAGSSGGVDGPSRVDAASWRVHRSFTHPIRTRHTSNPPLGPPHMPPPPPEPTFAAPRSSIVSASNRQGGTPRVSLAGAPLPLPEDPYSPNRVRLIDCNLILESLNQIGGHGKTLCVWPTEAMRTRGGRNYWTEMNWEPIRGMEGKVVYKWIPCHVEQAKRSHMDKTILLVQISDFYVPIAEAGVEFHGEDV